MSVDRLSKHTQQGRAAVHMSNLGCIKTLVEFKMGAGTSGRCMGDFPFSKLKVDDERYK